LKPQYIYNLWGIPLASNSYKMNIYFFQEGGILLFITQGCVLFTHLWFDLLFCVFVHSLNIMEIIRLFFIDHWFTWTPTTIHDLHCILIAWMLSRMKPLKFGLGTPFFNVMTLFIFHHRTHWTFMSSNCMSQKG
jgi:hypothetical protein